MDQLSSKHFQCNLNRFKQKVSEDQCKERIRRYLLAQKSQEEQKVARKDILEPRKAEGTSLSRSNWKKAEQEILASISFPRFVINTFPVFNRFQSGFSAPQEILHRCSSVERVLEAVTTASHMEISRKFRKSPHAGRFGIKIFHIRCSRQSE
jgi:hypothetical protein